MINYLHPGDLGTGSLLVVCFLGIGIVIAITFGLVYLAGSLADSHGKKWEERLKAEKLEDVDD